MLKRLLLAAAISAVGITSSMAQVAIGLKGSLQFANEKITSSGISINGENLLGFQAGLILKAPITDQLSIRPQLLYSTKGLKLLGSTFGGNGETKAVINYLEVPIQLAYSIEAGDGNVVLGAGPYLAYALSGKATVTVNGQSETEDLDFNDSDAQKRFDFGLNISAGYELNSGLGISAYYSPGLANLAPSNSGTNVTIKNSAFGISLSYFFGGN
ncbi:porin family protein [Fibrella sp. WM1]|uniref:porin family protein n=1 Tax=Fibrella musci TaxID=3242485 RepID=UPI0035201338